MERDHSFEAVMLRLATGDEEAEAQVFGRFLERLIALSRKKFDTWVRDRADVEGVVQSVYRSFFRRHARGEFALRDWKAVWRVLATIAVRKCRKRRAYLLADRRDCRREVALPADAEESAPPPGMFDREPRPDEAAMLADLVARLMKGLDPVERAVALAVLQGATAEEIRAERGCSEREVRRTRALLKSRAKRLWEKED